MSDRDYWLRIGQAFRLGTLRGFDGRRTAIFEHLEVTDPKVGEALDKIADEMVRLRTFREGVRRNLESVDDAHE